MATEEIGNLEIVEETPPTTPTQKEKTWSMQPRPSRRICNTGHAKCRQIYEQDAT